MRLRRDAGRVGRTSDGVRPCAARHLESGVERALSDGAHGGRPREIDGADRAFVADLACQRPADPGHSAGSRASDLPADRAGEAAEAVGHPRLATVATGSAHDILADAQTEPHETAHCRERRDPDLGARTRDVLLPRERPSLRLGEDGDPVPWEEGQEARVPSYDERPGPLGGAANIEAASASDIASSSPAPIPPSRRSLAHSLASPLPQPTIAATSAWPCPPLACMTGTLLPLDICMPPSARGPLWPLR